MKDDRVYVGHILEEIRKVEGFVIGLSFETFSGDNLLINGVVRSIEIIGEAARQMSDAFRKSHPEIPWLNMIDMRNKIIHEYFDVDVKIVWDTMKNDLPPLKAALRTLLESK